MSRLTRLERRTRILEAARKTLSERGFLGTRAQDVAGAARISPALLFRYYPTMGALRKAVVANSMMSKRERWPKNQFRMAPRLAMRSVALAFRSAFVRDPALLKLALFGALIGDPDPVEPYRSEVARATRRMVSLLRSWKRVGWCRADVNPRVVAGIFMSVMVHSILAEVVFGWPSMSGALDRDIQCLAGVLERSLTPGTRSEPWNSRLS